ncbi:MAG: hypothetical protein IPO45_01635 [Saprospiraceae bacterium]|nr:hypothetical protein [Candidatus Brachybacter algidus]MBP7307480.1 hypothetical protein [Saprospiraceae bacterium]MBK6450983.1 hypothetical protein [Candidatus Brachybacter algidus]MBK7604694.1 hypothetical protein [Candidatus Brachybacter algidus]MBK8355128.1 hypothetical protein [Candidatus Brachybacter algidus]
MEDWELEFLWLKARHQVKDLMNQEKLPELNTILLLIGIRELGKVKKKFSKEEKQDLMHIAVCTLLDPDGYYSYIGLDEDGWPHWSVNKPFTLTGVASQERYLKEKVIAYMDGV